MHLLNSVLTIPPEIPRPERMKDGDERRKNHFRTIVLLWFS